MLVSPRFSKRNFIFDLDGTLIDSFPGILESLRHAVSVVDPSLDLSKLKNHVGPPLPMMLQRIWPDLAEETTVRVLSEFRPDYNNRGCLYSTTYPGIPEALNRLRSSGVNLFLLTNKPQFPTRKILSHLGLGDHFTEILSPDSMNPAFSEKSEGALHMMRKHRLIAHETVLMGDSLDDWKAASVAGVSFLKASYGYGIIDDTIAGQAWIDLKSSQELVTIAQKFCTQ